MSELDERDSDEIRKHIVKPQRRNCVMHFGRRAALVTLLGTTLASCGLYWRYTARFRLKLVIQARHQIREAANALEIREAVSVLELTWSKAIGSGFDGIPTYYTQVQGQAPYAEMNGLGNVFALIQPPINYPGFDAGSTASILRPHVSPELTGQDEIENGSFIRAIKNLSAEFDIPQEQWPRLMSFSDPGCMTSARLMDSGGSSEVAIQRATLTRTNLPVTRGIEKALPWLAKPYPHLPRPTGNPDLWPVVHRLTRECLVLRG